MRLASGDYYGLEIGGQTTQLSSSVVSKQLWF